jgi:hypothetical protein
VTTTLYTGRVVQVDAAGPIVVVPQLGRSAPYGPLLSSVSDLAVGESVLIGNLGDTRDALVILGRAYGRAPTVGEVDGLGDRLDDIDAKDAAQDGRLTTVEGRATTVEGRATAVEGRAGALETRATAIEGVNTTQNTRLTTVEGVAAAAIPKALVTAKGDLVGASGSGVPVRQPVGADGLALVGSAAAASGLAYTEVRGIPNGGGLAGATVPTRFVGATTAGAPTTGTFAVGDFIVSRDLGDVWVCTAAGTPGTWVSSAAALRTELYGAPTATRRPFGHIGRTLAFQTINNYATPQLVQMNAAQDLVGGVTFDAATYALTVPVAGRYRLTHHLYATGSAGVPAQGDITINSTTWPTDTATTRAGAFALFWKADANDYIAVGSVVRTLAAGDKLRAFFGSLSNTWGTTGYNGAWLEAEFVSAP